MFVLVIRLSVSASELAGVIVVCWACWVCCVL